MATESACFRTAPIQPKTLKILAKCKYHPKLLARCNGSSGSWRKRIEERVLDMSVAMATASVIVLDFESVIFLQCYSEENFEGIGSIYLSFEDVFVRQCKLIIYPR